jgi:putative endopeptidase
MIRAFAPLTDMPEFFAAFSIKEGDPMYRKPEERAKIW